jgi:peroxiredoxin
MLTVLPWVRSFLIAAMIVAALALYSLKGHFSQNEKSPAAVVETKVNKLGIETPKRKTIAPEFVLEDPAGKQVSLRELRGKIVFLNFWATWCLPCIEEMPAIEKLHQKLVEHGLVVLAVNFQEGPERVKDFFTEQNLTFTALLDRDGKVAELYQVWGLPVSVVINKRGEIVGRAVGSKDWYSDEARHYFQRLLAEES